MTTPHRDRMRVSRSPSRVECGDEEASRARLGAAREVKRGQRDRRDVIVRHDARAASSRRDDVALEVDHVARQVMVEEPGHAGEQRLRVSLVQA